MSSDLLTVSEAAQWLKVSEAYLNKLRMYGGSPKFVRLGRSIRYRIKDLDTWVSTKVADADLEDAGGDE
jgi:excisionase family DNA binding protein